MRGRNVNTSRQFTNFPPLHQARLTKHYKTLVGQENFLGEKELLCPHTLEKQGAASQRVFKIHGPPAYMTCTFKF